MFTAFVLKNAATNSSWSVKNPAEDIIIIIIICFYFYRAFQESKVASQCNTNSKQTTKQANTKPSAKRRQNRWRQAYTWY